MSFESNLASLKRLQYDSEKHLLEFNEIIPYEHNPEDVYSPRLVNLILQLGPQVENIIDLIVKKLQLKPQGSGTPSRIKEINKTGILSKLRIISIPHQLQFTPFTDKLEWWDDYQYTKHDLSKFQFKVTYSAVMNSASALAGFHKLADTIKIADAQNTLDKIFDKNNWKDYQKEKHVWAVSISEIEAGLPIWQSSVFRISTYYINAKQRKIW